VLQPKSVGRALMFSDFVTFNDGLLRRPEGSTVEAHKNVRYLVVGRAAAAKDGPAPVTGAGITWDVGANRDGYFTGEDLMAQVEHLTVPTFDSCFPNAIACFVFDNASSHLAFNEDALRASEMNVGPGGKVPLMRPSKYTNAAGVECEQLMTETGPNGVLRARGTSSLHDVDVM
jgi:hypothetical protein